MRVLQAALLEGGNLSNTPASWLHIGPSNIEGDMCDVASNGILFIF